MADAIELATAYVQIVPSMKGAKGTITEALGGAAKPAGDKAAAGFSQQFTAGLGKVKGTVGKAIVGLVSAKAVKAGVTGLYRIGETFDDVADTIRVGTGATGATLDTLIDVAKEVGKTVPAEFEKIGPVIADVNTRLGLSGDTLERVASQYLEAGRILGQEVDIQATTAAFSAFGIEGGNVEGALDQLFRVSQATGLGMNELAGSTQKNAATFKTMGYSFEDATAMIGVFDKAGMDSNRTMAAMAKGMVELAKDGEEPRATMERVASRISRLVEKGKEAKALDLAADLFGTRGAAQFVQALKDGTLNAKDLTAALAVSGDTIVGVSAETSDFAERWQTVKNNALLALEPLASGLFGSLSAALQDMMPHIQAFSSWLADNQWLIAAFAILIGTTLALAFFTWAAGIWASTIALLANPITWIVLAIVALIAALILLIANWDTVVAWVKDVWGKFVGWLKGIWDKIVMGVKLFGQVFKDLWDRLWQGIGDFFKNIWDGLVGWVKGIWDSIVAAVAGFGDRFRAWWDGIWQAVGDFFKGVWSGISGFFTSVWDKILTFVKAVPDKIMGFLRGLAALPGKAAEWFGGVLTSAKEKFGQVIDWVKDVPNKILDKLKGIGTLLLDSGKKLVTGFLDGIKNAWGTLTGWVKDGLANLRGLWPFSPAKWGPFSGRGYVTFSGEALTTDFARAIRAGIPSVTAAGSDLMGAAVRASHIDVTATSATSLGAGAVLPGVTGAVPSGLSVAVESMTVRDESDIRKVAQELYRLSRRDARAVRVGV